MSAFNIGIFKGPKYSRFDIDHGNRVSTKPGIMKPVWWEILNTGDRLADFDVQNIVRQAPMLAPTLDTYDVTIDAFAVRLRTIGQSERNPWVYEDFFNLNRNISNDKRLPSFPLGVFWAHHNPLKTGNLSESLNLPSFKWLREIMMDFIRSHSYYTDPVVKLSLAHSFLAADSVQMVGIFPASLPSGSATFTQGDTTVTTIVQKIVTDNVRINNHNFTSRKAALARYAASASFSVGSYFLPLRTLVEFVGEHYPDAIPRPNYVSSTNYSYVSGRGGLIFQFTGSSAETRLIAATDCVKQGFVSDGSLNILDNVYEHYKVDALSVLAEYFDSLCDDFMNLIGYGSNLWDSDFAYFVSQLEDKAGGYYAGHSIISIWMLVVSQVLSQMSDVPEYSTEEETSIFDLSEFPHFESYADDLKSYGFVFNSDDASGVAHYVERLIPTYPFNSYWKIISDWYINTALFEPDSFYLDHFMPAFDELSENSRAWYIGNDSYIKDIDDFNGLFYRYWRNDYFTSAFPNSQLGSAVGIPVNGTIIDLRNANAMQKLKERLLYAGSRFRDVLFAITGKKTSAAIMDMSEPIGRWFMSINVDSVLQQSQSTSEHPQASYAGTGLGYKLHGKKVSYTAEEPTVIMVVMSLTPRASYFDGLPRKFMRSSVYDYAIPQLANVGEQDIKRVELFAGLRPSGSTPFGNTVFGWTRRNADFIWFPDEVHGDFRTDLDYWHNARVFGSAPTLNEKFLQIRPDDDNLNRVFAVSSPVVDKFYCHVIFSGGVIRSLPKHVYYDL